MDKKNLILIVDDQPKNLQLLAAVLYKNNYEVAMADSGISALEILENITPDLILLDIMMPEMDGFDVIEKIKEDDKLSDIPIIFLTAKNDNESIVKSFEVGASDYITKPFNNGELLSRVNTHIQLFTKTQKLSYMNSHLEQLVKERTEELDLANKRLSKLDDAKSYFISLMSHELRTPVNGIKGFAGIIKQELKDPSLQEYCDLVLDATGKLEKFTETSLLITKLKSEKYKLTYESYDIHKIINESLFRIQEKLEDKKINVDTKFCTESIFINIDPYLINQTISIVLENAVKFNNYSGSIEIETILETDEIKIIISDSGNGFTEEMLENKFTLFNSDELLSHTEGFGLGLATAKIIMNYHSGDINLENNGDSGAKVTLIFNNSKN